MIGIRMELRQELRLRPWEPIPPTLGLEGLRRAHQTLQAYKTHGILIGGVARDIWSGITDPAVFAAHKDVDVIVLSRHCSHHPGQWESGIDWWINHVYGELPTNGTATNIIWRLTKCFAEPVPFGLYLPPRDLFVASMEEEKKILGSDYQVPEVTMVDYPNFREFPIMKSKFLRVHWGRKTSPLAKHCKQA